MTSPRAKDPCHCGSGKRYKHCHMSQERSKSKSAFWLLAVPIFVVLIVGIALWARQSNAPVQGALPPGVRGAPQSAAAGSMTASANQDPLPGGRVPADWEFDRANNRHWSPSHGHWHEGPPPPPDQRDLTATTVTQAENTNPTIPNPTPWQYDATSDKHFDPGHKHWHAGPPPPPEQRTVTSVTTESQTSNPGIPNPTPWQYDATSDKHFDPGHKHWHAGPPPANRDSS